MEQHMNNTTDQITYTTVYHGARLKLGLTINEYAVADLIYHLSANPNAEMHGWCYASKTYIGNMLGLSEKSVHVILKKLLGEDEKHPRVKILEKHPETKYLRTTSTWYDTVVINRRKFSDTEQSSARGKKGKSDTEQSSVDLPLSDTEQSSDNNNIYNNKDKDFSKFSKKNTTTPKGSRTPKAVREKPATVGNTLLEEIYKENSISV